MRTQNFSKFTSRVLGSLLIAACCIMPLHSAESPKGKINQWIHSYPYLGLISKEVAYGPITLKNLDFDGSGHVVIAEPGEVIDGTVHYKIDSSKLESMNLHHIIVGIKDQDAQSCITHSLGVWNRKGKSSFSLKAPLEKGVYEVRFDYQNSLCCEDAIAAWQADAPSSNATVGVIIVE